MPGRIVSTVRHIRDLALRVAGGPARLRVVLTLAAVLGLVRQAEVNPQPELVLREDPVDRPWWWAVRYVLRVRTNVVIIVTSALGYFFFVHAIDDARRPTWPAAGTGPRGVGVGGPCLTGRCPGRG